MTLILGLLVSASFLLSGSSAEAACTPSELNTLMKGNVVIEEANTQDRTSDSGMATVVAKIIIPSSPEEIWPILTNPQELMSQEKKVKSVKVVRKNGNTHDVEYTVSYSKLLPTFNYVLRLENKQPNSIRFKRISGSFKDIQGSWNLSPIENGQKSVLTYTLSIDPGFFAPKFILVQAIKSDLPTMMKNVKMVIFQNTTKASKL
ncbi:MAG: SRPBCC family protein [Cyanobacteria bacterium]|nr:SRPBCC family protein [Cyanobacteriota bacterium]